MYPVRLPSISRKYPTNHGIVKAILRREGWLFRRLIVFRLHRLSGESIAFLLFYFRGEDLKRWIYLLIGIFSLGLGSFGLILPILPTTPFLLLAAYCFLRSNLHFYRWLTTHPIFGTMIHDFMTHRRVARKTKRIAIRSLWVSILVSILAMRNLMVSVLLLGIALMVTFYLRSLEETVENKTTIQT